MQKIKPFDHPPSIEDLIYSHRMTVKNKGFSVTTIALINGYFDANDEPLTMDNLRMHASAADMTVVRMQDSVVFRKLMKPMEDMTQIQRASGDVICDVCKIAFKFHPKEPPPNDFLNVLCNGRRVKL